MLVVAAFLLQVAGPMLPPPRPSRGPVPCPVGDDGEVVVCASDQRQFRLGPAPRACAGGTVLPQARLTLGDGTVLSAETERDGVGGFTSNRAMLRLKKGL